VERTELGLALSLRFPLFALLLSLLFPLSLYDVHVQRLGIVDLGSGTSRLVVYSFDPGKQYRLVDEIRETVRLGEGLAQNNKLTQAGMQRALSALKMYADFAEATDLDELRVIATSASRDADNGAEFMAQVRKLGLNVRVLSGEDEAKFGVLAVANCLPFEDAWVMDLGGGSAQLSRMQDRRYKFGQAYPLGAVRLTEMFFKSDPPKKGEVEDLERFARKEMKEVLGQVRDKKLPLVAMGGTVRNLAKLVQKRRQYPLDLIHGYFLRRGDLEDLVHNLLSRATSQRKELEGMNADRADIIAAGALVYQTVLKESNSEGLWISGQGVREGAFYQEFLPAPYLVENVRSFSVQNLFARYPQDRAHTTRVRKFCKQIFNALEPLHGYGKSEEQLLDEAALLHDIGMSVSYYDHHKHGEYLVMSAAIPGLTHREQTLLGLLVRYHRKGEPKVGIYKDILEDRDAKLLLRLTSILRMTEYLERSRAGRVTGLDIRIEPRTVRIGLESADEPWVELTETNKQARLFQQAFGRELALEWSDR
jgi:exopolyphosphatase / guanosine-5'-triphosphate,3'-diphosphate pyrophosphatase